MLYREIIAVCSQIHTKHINTLCGQNAELFNVKLAVYLVTTGLQRIESFPLHLPNVRHSLLRHPQTVTDNCSKHSYRRAFRIVWNPKGIWRNVICIDLLLTDRFWSYFDLQWQISEGLKYPELLRSVDGFTPGPYFMCQLSLVIFNSKKTGTFRSTALIAYNLSHRPNLVQLST